MPAKTSHERHRLGAVKLKTQDLPSEENLGNRNQASIPVSGRLRELFEHPAAHYVIATIIVVTIAVVKGQLDSMIGEESPFVLLFGSILLSAWRGGLGPGLYATVLACAISYHYFLPPQGSFFGKSSGQNLRMLLFLCEGTLASLLCSSRLKTEEVISRARHLLERRVEMRTSELAETNRFLRDEVNERAALQKDLKEARDAALESVRLKSEFLANMSHEIRTPMNGVVGMTGLLLDTRLDSEQRRYAEIIRSSGESLMTIINDILDFSKIDAGKLELEKLDFDLRDLIESTIELLGERVRDQANEISAMTYADVPSSLRGDPGRLRQVLTNFISNAAKFTSDGQITVSVKKEHETAGRAFLEFSVSDTGVGIPEDVRKRLFQPFTQSDASTTRKFGGTGLGLSISKRLVEMMGGQIGVDSEEGKGSRFWFKVALEKREESSNVFLGHSAEAAEALHGRRVLVVDDNPVNRKLLAYEFLSWSMDVEQTESGIDAIARVSSAEAESRQFDLIVLDMQMPVMNGLETAERLGRIASPVRDKFERPPIIMVSSSGARANKAEFSKLDIHHYLAKPYRREDLLDAVIGSLKNARKDEAEEVLLRTEAPDKADVPTEAEFEGFRVLLVEDNPVNQMVAQTQLKKFGCRADVASNGIEALKALEMMPYDLVLMDCQMPEMDGYQATREIRKRQWAAAVVPVVALTAHAIEGEREKCIDAGMDDYLSKPVGKEHLKAMLRKWLKPVKNLTQGPGVGPVPTDVLELPFAPQASPAGYEGVELLAVHTDEGSGSAVTQVVDIEVLKDITGGDSATLVEVLEMYLEQTELYLKEMETAVARSDADALYKTAHKAVGSSSLCGMTVIVGPIRDLERSGRSGDLRDAVGQLARVKSGFAAIKMECAELLRQQAVGSAL